MMQDMTTFISADLHIGHKGIIQLCNRPFVSVDHMNAELVQRWNAVVGPTDEVWFLGDFCWKGHEHYFHQLQGDKHLIIGNHDHHAVLTLPWASQPQDYVEIKLPDKTGQTYKIVLNHYPYEEWNGYYKGAIHLHGHVHGRPLNPIPRRVDVGVDAWNFSPITLDQIITHVAARTVNPQ